MGFGDKTRFLSSSVFDLIGETFMLMIAFDLLCILSARAIVSRIDELHKGFFERSNLNAVRWGTELDSDFEIKENGV